MAVSSVTAFSLLFVVGVAAASYLYLIISVSNSSNRR
jgi:hypothetical protein